MTALSLQLYSARNFTPWESVFKTISQLGFGAVEGYSALFEDTDAVCGALQAAGLSMPTAHMGLSALETDLAGAVATARAFGIGCIYAPFLAEAERPIDSEGWVDLAKRLDVVAMSLADEGLEFGWHNHDFEMRCTADGAMPMKIILEEAPGIHWQADLAWIARGGADPMAWIKTYGSRINAVHIKDIAPAGQCADEDGWADVGAGTMDWPRLMTAIREKSQARHFIMEHDNPNNLTRFARRSMEHFKTCLGANNG